MLKTFILSLALAVLASVAAQPVLAYVMSSTSYRIERDTLSTGGGLGTSTSYGVESTLGDIATGYTTTTSYDVLAGYQQMPLSAVSITIPSVGTIPGINANVGGSGDTTASLTMATGEINGYTMQMKASTSPALQSGSNSFADYVPAGANPDYTWSVGSASSAFGFTPEGADIVDRYLDNGVSCNQVGGSDASSSCWDGLSTSYVTIAQSSAGNMPSGTLTSIRFRAEAGASAAQPSGTYTASIFITAFAN